MRHLKPPAWADGLSVNKEKDKNNQSSSDTKNKGKVSISSSSSAGSSSSVVPLPSPSLPASPLIVELVNSLTHRRLYREVTLAVCSGLQDAEAHFSFLRIKGLKALLKALSSFSSSDSLIHLFQVSQADKTLQVVPILFKHCLANAKSPPMLVNDPVCFDEPLQVISPPTDYEVTLALRVLEGCCILDKGSRRIASHYMAVKEVIELLSVGGLLERAACLDALPALMLDTPINQQEFIRHQGIRKISELVKYGHVDEAMRLKCAEFLFLLVGSLLPIGSAEKSELNVSAEDALAESQELLGDAFYLVCKEVDQAAPSFFNSQKRGEVLHSQAKQWLEWLDSSNW